MREGEQLVDDETLVVRGGALDSDTLRTDAMRHHQIYGTYGLSVFAVRNVSFDELAQQAPFVRFPVVTLMKAATLRSAALSLLPTGRNPLHVTVGFEDLDEGVDRLCNCEHRTVVNPYHEDESRGTGR